MASLNQPSITAIEANATGQAVFVFPRVDIGFYWTVAILVPGVPTGAQFTLLENGQPLYPWVGPLPSPSLQVNGGATLSVFAVGLVPGTQYVAFARGSITAGTSPGNPPGTVAAYVKATLIDTTVTIANYLPTSVAGILTVDRKLLGSGTPVQVDATFPFKIGLTISALTSNTGVVRIGGGPASGAPVSANSYGLSPGQGIPFAVANANVIWLLGTTGDHAECFGE